MDFILPGSTANNPDTLSPGVGHLEVSPIVSWCGPGHGSITHGRSSWYCRIHIPPLQMVPHCTPSFVSLATSSLEENSTNGSGCENY